MKKWYWICALILILSISSGIYYFSVYRVHAMEIPENIMLETHDGEIVSLNETGKVRILEFIYTKCPDICPATTIHMNSLKEDLRATGITADEVEFLTITIDSKRDTKEVLASYVETFNIDTNDGWKVLRGNEDDIRNLTSELEFYYQDPGNGMYTHTSTTYLLNQQNQVVEMFGMGNKGFKPEKVLQSIKKLL